jgi:hypothetical protein
MSSCGRILREASKEHGELALRLCFSRQPFDCSDKLAREKEAKIPGDRPGELAGLSTYECLKQINTTQRCEIGLRELPPPVQLRRDTVTGITYVQDRT